MVQFDSSIAGFTPEEWHDMDAQEREQALYELENRAQDIIAVVDDLRCEPSGMPVIAFKGE